MVQSCCNPFSLPNHNWSNQKKCLISVTSWMRERAPISVGSKICDNCMKKLSQTTMGPHVKSDSDIDSPEIDVDSLEVDVRSRPLYGLYLERLDHRNGHQHVKWRGKRDQ